MKLPTGILRGPLPLVLLAGFLWPVLRQLVAVYESVPDYSHGYLVPLISLWVIYRSWEGRPAAQASAWGLVFLIPGVLLVGLAVWYDTAMRPGGLGTECLGGLGAWLCLLGVSLASFGFARTRYWAFPLGYLLCAIPLPDSLTLMVTLPMREAVSSLATVLLQFGGMDVVREGHVLRLPNALLGVEDACSGIRSLWSLFASSIAIAYLMQGRWRLVMLCGVLAFPLSFFQNILRVLITTVLVNRYGGLYAEGWRHSLTGGLTFALAALVMVALAVWLSIKQGLREARTIKEHASSPLGRFVPLISATLLVSGIVVLQVVSKHYRPLGPLLEAQESARRPLVSLPARIGSFSRLDFIDLHPGHLEILQPIDSVAAEYAAPNGERIHLMLFYWAPQRVGAFQSTARPHSPDVCFPAVGFHPVEASIRSQSLSDRGPQAQVRLFRKEAAEKVVVHWQNRSVAEAEQYFPARMHERWRALCASWSQAEVILGHQFSVTIGVDVGLRAGDAEQLALRFAESLQPVLEAFGLSDLDASGLVTP